MWFELNKNHFFNIFISFSFRFVLFYICWWLPKLFLFFFFHLNHWFFCVDAVLIRVCVCMILWVCVCVVVDGNGLICFCFRGRFYRNWNCENKLHFGHLPVWFFKINTTLNTGKCYKTCANNFVCDAFTQVYFVYPTS